MKENLNTGSLKEAFYPLASCYIFSSVTLHVRKQYAISLTYATNSQRKVCFLMRMNANNFFLFIFINPSDNRVL